jgi:alanyl-tRNA synthetase
VADLLRIEPDGVVAALERVLARQREADKELSKLRQQSSESVAAELAEGAVDGFVVGRQDGMEPKALQTLAQAVLRHDGPTAVVLAGTPDGVKVTIAGATGPGGPDATELVRALGAIVGGGGGGSAELALAGGKDPARLDQVLDEARRLLSE